MGQVILLLACALVLSRYWMMLLVWMRWVAGTGLGLALAIVLYRLFKFHRAQK